MHDSQKNYDDLLPQLMPLEKKSISPLSKNARILADQIYRPKQQLKSPAQNQPNLQKDQSIVSKLPENQRVASKKNDENRKRRQADSKKRNQISKNLITEMMNKISLRSITEQNYPVSNQTIERLMIDLDDQIFDLTEEFNKFDNSLLLNPTNQHLKKELQAVEKSLNQIKTIKDLYHEKIDNRSKITELEAKITELKSQNRELKIKISRGIQKIQSHIHNLPCEREKELIEQVNKYRLSLSREKDMRQNLQKNISSIVLNFKRFYVEADEARKLITEQLKYINQKQHQLSIKLENINHQKNDFKNGASIDIKSVRVDSNIESSDALFKEHKNTNRPAEQENMADLINQINQRQREKGTKLQKIEEFKRARKNTISQLGSTIAKRQRQVEAIDTERTKFNLQQQIEKMRANQQQFSKLTRKKY